jgi:general secretion pathway protein F
MPAFNYIAFDNNGKKHAGILEGDSSRQIRQKLREQGFIPAEVNIVKEAANRQWVTSRRKRIKVSDLALLTRQMATLLSAGMPIEEVLTATAEQTEKPYVKGIIMGVRARVLEGHTLATGMQTFPRAFSHLYRATVAAGEQSGYLDHILNRLADYMEKQHRMQQKIRQALIYPSLMTIISIAIVVFLLIFVVPKIVGVFSDSTQSLPAVTLTLLAISHFVQYYGIYTLFILIVTGFIFQHLLKKIAFRRSFHFMLLRLPILGNTLKIINSARFSRTFGILFSASVPVLDAMRVGCELISLVPMREAVEVAISRVREGSSIHQALKQTHYFSPMSIHLMASGEKSGQLENMLEKAADAQEYDVASLIDNVLALFEPLMIIIMGMIVLFIVLAVLLPIFQLDAIAGQA